MKTKIKELFLNEEKDGITMIAELADGRTAKIHEVLVGGQWALVWKIEPQTCRACGQEVKSCGGYDRCRYVNGC